MNVTAPHNFRERLNMSIAASDEPFWSAVYEKAFPDMVNHMLCNGDTVSQRMGIDRVIHLSNGRNLRIDEKKRDKVYPDILLEYLSNDQTGAPGWIEKPLFIDYLAYAFMPTQTVYLFDWLMLKRAWSHYGPTWKRQYRHIEAQNVGYKTKSIAVPIKVVQRAINTASVIVVRGVLLEEKSA